MQDPPWRSDSVSGGDFGRDRLIRAQSMLGWGGESRGFNGSSPND